MDLNPRQATFGGKTWKMYQVYICDSVYCITYKTLTPFLYVAPPRDRALLSLPVSSELAG